LERGYWNYDYLAQYLAARGYAVLQIHEATEPFEWSDDDGFRFWPKAVANVVAATDRLVADGTADRDRICVAGLHYGGHTALMSAIEQPDRYACIVSIGGIADPAAMAAIWGHEPAARLIRRDDLVRKQGSPIERVDEITAPVLIVHAGLDIEAPLSQARDFARRLRRRDKDVTFVGYSEATGDFRPRLDRMDMLDRVGEFLRAHLDR
jgi:dipeptidyl aminopeptidase/acylaminoacyl peptidase